MTSKLENELDLINEYKADIYNAIKDKGVDIPANTPLSKYADKVSSISGGGSSKTYNILTNTFII